MISAAVLLNFWRKIWIHALIPVLLIEKFWILVLISAAVLDFWILLDRMNG